MTDESSTPDPNEPLLFVPEFDKPDAITDEEIQGMTDFLDAVFGSPTMHKPIADESEGGNSGYTTWNETQKLPFPDIDPEKLKVVVVDSCEGVGAFWTAAPAELLGGKEGDPDVDFLVFNFVQRDGEMVAVHFSLNAWDAFAELAEIAIVAKQKGQVQPLGEQPEAKEDDK